MNFGIYLNKAKTNVNESSVVEILVENMGRASYQNDQERPGFQGNVYFEKNKTVDWEHISLDFSDAFLAAVKTSKWQTMSDTVRISKSYPALYKVFVDIKEPKDTFLDMMGWGKGIAILNGFNLGRNWHIGPQRTLYVPKPLLRQGANDLLVFELEKPSTRISFVGQPLLENSW